MREGNHKNCNHRQVPYLKEKHLTDWFMKNLLTHHAFGQKTSQNLVKEQDELMKPDLDSTSLKPHITNNLLNDHIKMGQMRW